MLNLGGTSQPTAQEANAVPFSVLNLATGASTGSVFEVSPTPFSVLNLATGVSTGSASRSVRPRSGSQPGDGRVRRVYVRDRARSVLECSILRLALLCLASEASVLSFSVENLASGVTSGLPDQLLQSRLSKIGQTVTFVSSLDLTLGGAPLVAPARASSGLPVTLTAVGSCVVSESAVIAMSAGECTLTATRTGDALYDAADPGRSDDSRPSAAPPPARDDQRDRPGAPPVPGSLYAGTAGGAFRTDDGGLHWQHAGALFSARVRHGHRAGW